jgi:hypothetical protein
MFRGPGKSTFRLALPRNRGQSAASTVVDRRHRRNLKGDAEKWNDLRVVAVSPGGFDSALQRLIGVLFAIEMDARHEALDAAGKLLIPLAPILAAKILRIDVAFTTPRNS